MIERSGARLEVSRAAVALILEHGLAATSGDDIAAASGRSTRTIWRYFRSKESCVEPLLITAVNRFIGILRRWPLAMSIEQYLHAKLPILDFSEQEVADDLAAVRLIALLPHEPALKTAWLMACAQAEGDYLPVVARRSGRLPDDFELRLCVATTLTAMRLFHEEFSAAVTDGRALSVDLVAGRLAAVIRAASTLPICDPVAEVAAVPIGNALFPAGKAVTRDKGA